MQNITLICVIGVAFLAYILFILFKPQVKKGEGSYLQKKNVENFNLKGDPLSFVIYNYLKHNIRVESITVHGNNGVGVATYSTPVELAKIPSQSKVGIPMHLAENHINQNTKIRVYTYQENYPGKGEVFFAEYAFNTPKETTLKKLHVGMITSRWTGADGDYNIGKPGANAVQGLPWIKIHNLTDRPLALNNNINISPGGTLRYTGRDHFGVRLGTVFEDQDGTYPDFIFTTPATDVYYGVVSDVLMPEFGGWQANSLFMHDSDEPQYLLESGWMGGPAPGKIPLGRLPIEGPEVPPKDRWGQNVPAALNHPVGPPIVENDPQDW